MSKAWFKPSSIPQRIAIFHPSQCVAPGEATRKRAVEVWTTTCIVANFGMRRGRHRQGTHQDEVQEELHQDGFESSHPRCSTLINPANPNLTGPHSFPYFPRGGPQPSVPPNRHAHHIMGYVSQWGGMDVGSGEF